MRKIVCLVALLTLVVTFALSSPIQAAELTVQSIVSTGINPALTAAAAGGDTFDNDGNTFYWIDNASGGSLTVTFAAVATCSLGDLHNIAVAVGAAEDAMIGPFPTHIYNGITGEVSVTYSGVTSLTVGAIKL